MMTAKALVTSSSQPLGDMNTTPLIDVMLVLLVVFILAVPAAVNEVQIELPAAGPAIEHPPVDPHRNTIVIDASGEIDWNGQTVTRAQLSWLLVSSRRLRPEPELRFKPDAMVPYEAAAQVLNLIRRSGVSAFGFVDNERYASFGKAGSLR
ncbi:MAG: ExbD/TolR family protein [Novosphingobium sp.]